MTHSRNQSDASYGEWLARHRDETARLTQSHRRIELLWSWGRLLAFWGIAVVWYLLGGGISAWLATVFLLAVFYLAVRKHRAAKARREMGERELSMIDESQRRTGGKLATKSLVPVCVSRSKASRPACHHDAYMRLPTIIGLCTLKASSPSA